MGSLLVSDSLNYGRRRVLAAAALGCLAKPLHAMPDLGSIEAGRLPILGDMPDFIGLTDWFNDMPLTRQRLMGKVLVVDFWALGCINCRHALPHVAAWYEQYKSQGFIVVGIHTPEFDSERPMQAVRQAAVDMKLKFPIALDNNFQTWRAFNNRYWPSAYFIDARGRIRYQHEGEGAYDQGENVIRALLAERDGQSHRSGG